VDKLSSVTWQMLKCSDFWLIATITSQFGFACVWVKLGHGNHMIIVTPSFLKSSFFKCFLFTRKQKAGVFKFLRFQERFQKDPFVWWISVDGGPNRRNKAALSNFSGVVWTGPNWKSHHVQWRTEQNKQMGAEFASVKELQNHCLYKVSPI